MEQRRVILFLMLSFLVLVLNSMLFPPAPAPDDNKLPKPEEQAAEQQPEAEAQLAETDPNQDATEPQAPRADANVEPVADVPLEYVTLGSVAEDSDYRLLVTLTNRGAAVRRIELTSPRYRDLQDRGGYLGHLELEQDPQGGLIVQAVGTGTPAQEAGVEIGDRLLSGSSGKRSATFASPADLSKLLSKLKPGKTLQLDLKDSAGQPKQLDVELMRRPLEVIRPESENELMRSGSVPDGYNAPPSCLLTLQKVGQAQLSDKLEEIAGVRLLDSNWEVTARDESSVAFRQRVAEYGLEVIKRYRLATTEGAEDSEAGAPAYHVTLDIEIRNLSAAPLDVAYRLDGPNGLPLEGWWYANKVGREWTVGLRDIVARHVGADDPQQFGPQAVIDGEVERMEGNPLAYIGIDAQYFSAMLIPEKPTLDTKWIARAEAVLLSPPPKARSAAGRFANVSVQLTSETNQLAAGAALKNSYKLFAGPKKPELISQYTVAGDAKMSLGDLEYYGWFSSVSTGMLQILHFFYGIFGNYGIAIILLTVLVRLCLFPISRKQAKSMAAMQALRPEMDKLKEKYKNDMQKQSQEMQELYRKHDINPLGGCLPMFIQLPIMLGLYRALSVDIELRQAPLISEAVRWCSNLAAPDTLFDWSSFMPDFITSGEGIIGLGPYFNILPICTIVLWIVQQKLFMPEAANEQAAMQQKIMQYMMIFMGFMFFKVASGLCIYFITSTIWGIAERKLVPPPTVSEGSLAASSGNNGGNGGGRNGEKRSSGKPKPKRKPKKKR